MASRKPDADIKQIRCGHCGNVLLEKRMKRQPFDQGWLSCVCGHDTRWVADGLGGLRATTRPVAAPASAPG